MHRFITLVCAVTAATLLVVGCSSSDDSSSPSSGGSGGSGATGGSSGSGGGTSDAQCVGEYSDRTQSAFTAEVTADGKCIGTADTTAICSTDVTATAEACGGDCFKAGGDAAAQDACTSKCLTAMVPTLTADCVGCYVTDVGCARAHCLLSCGTAPTSQGCADCRDTNGCVSGFYSCSGVPEPGSAPTGSAGAGG